MIDIAAIVEGPTEQAFVQNFLAQHFGGHGVYIWACLPGRVRKRGGTHKWESVRGDIIRTLKQHPGRICTTMFDYYGLPNDWPGRTEAAAMPLNQKASHIEQALLNDLAVHAAVDFRHEWFVPYIQIHEFEALLFADVVKMAETLAPVCGTLPDRLNTLFQAILDEAHGQAEAINDSYETCPSRRITKLVHAYRKPVYGPIIANKIGLDALRTACPHFGQWLGRLEAIGANASTTP